MQLKESKIHRYHKWIEWSDEDKAFIGKCPDLITGIHGDDPLKLYEDLCEVVQEVIDHIESKGENLPEPKTRPMKEIN